MRWGKALDMAHHHGRALHPQHQRRPMIAGNIMSSGNTGQFTLSPDIEPRQAYRIALIPARGVILAPTRTTTPQGTAS